MTAAEKCVRERVLAWGREHRVLPANGGEAVCCRVTPTEEDRLEAQKLGIYDLAALAFLRELEQLIHECIGRVQRVS